MRKLVYFCLLAIFFAACQSNDRSKQSQDATDSVKGVRVEQSQNQAIIEFDSIYFDLGALEIDGPDQARDFTFTNKGTTPLVIEKIESSCTCLDIVYPKESIAPSEKSKITMTLKMQDISSGQFYRSALVYSNASAEPTEIILMGIKKYE